MQCILDAGPFTMLFILIWRIHPGNIGGSSVCWMQKWRLQISKKRQMDWGGTYRGKRKAVEGSRRRAVADGSGSGRGKRAGKKSKKYCKHEWFIAQRPTKTWLFSADYFIVPAVCLKIKHSPYSWLYLHKHSRDAMQVIKNDGIKNNGTELTYLVIIQSDNLASPPHIFTMDNDSSVAICITNILLVWNLACHL